MAMTYIISEICGDWSLHIKGPGTSNNFLFFKSRNNAELVKSILEWEDAHPNKAVPYMPTLTPPNEPLTLEQLREMDGEPVWVEDVKHWALIDIEKGGQWDGVPFAIWAENGMKFTYNIKNRGLHCYRRPPEGEEDT